MESIYEQQLKIASQIYHNIDKVPQSWCNYNYINASSNKLIISYDNISSEWLDIWKELTQPIAPNNYCKSIGI